jgi:acetylglutamate kinase
MSQPRLELLREALPYIRRFKGKTFVVKLSGKVTEDHENLGVEQTIIEGRRVTDDATLDMAKMVFAGKINTDILAALRHRGVEAVGLSGVDGDIVHAVRRPPKEVVNRETGVSSSVDFGHVGDVVEINDRLLRVLLDHDYMPVVSSLGADSEGRVFNINADTIAAEIAVRLEAEKLVMLSDVDGIYLRPGEQATKISRLTAGEIDALIRDGAAPTSSKAPCATPSWPRSSRTRGRAR